MKRVMSVANIANPYLKRILSYVIGKDPLRVLSGTPGSLQHLTRGLDQTQIRKSPERGKWSIGQIITHLCDAELVLGFRFRMVISQSGSPLQAMDQNKWAIGLKYNRADWKKKLKLFTAMRRDHLALLRSLNSREWKQYGIHEERGKENLELMVQMLAGHDVNHLMQIETIRNLFLKRKKG